MTHSTNNHSETLKAGALLCPICCVEYEKLEADFEFDGTIFKKIKILRCPICQEEQISPEQQDLLEKQIRDKRKGLTFLR